MFLHGLAEVERDDWSVELLNLTRETDMGTGGALDLANLKRTLDDAKTLRRRAKEADIVHIHSALSPHPTLVRAGLLSAISRSAGAKVVIHAHGGRLLGWADRTSRRRLVRAMLGVAHKVIAVSSGVAGVIEAELGDRVSHVANGVDLDAFAPGDDRSDIPTLLYVGILTERKGVLDLLAASALLADRGVEHRTVLVGGRPDEGTEEHARVLAAIDASPAPVELTGPIEHHEVVDWYRKATVFCLPSWWEAMPLSILEAMACAIPVVATDVGDIAATVGDTERLVEVHDQEALADKLEPLLRDPALAASVGRDARQRVETEFDITTTYDRIFSIFDEVLA